MLISYAKQEVILERKAVAFAGKLDLVRHQANTIPSASEGELAFPVFQTGPQISLSLGRLLRRANPSARRDDGRSRTRNIDEAWRGRSPIPIKNIHKTF
jgi:hypothetical protein